MASRVGMAVAAGRRRLSYAREDEEMALSLFTSFPIVPRMIERSDFI